MLRQSPAPLAAAAIATAMLVGPAAAGPQTMSKDALRDGVKDAREQLTAAGLRVNQSWTMDDGPSDAIQYSRTVLELQDEKYKATRFRKQDGDEVEVNDVAYNGERSWRYQRFNNRLLIEDGPGLINQVSTEAYGIFELMAWDPTHEIMTGSRRDRDLLAILSSDNAVVRPETEEINGRETHVVDLYRLGTSRSLWQANTNRFVKGKKNACGPPTHTGGLVRTVWIDAERGYLPIRQQSYRPSRDTGEPEISFVFQITEARELADGLWIPVEGRRQSRFTEYRIAVVRTDDGIYDVAIAPDIPASHFDLSNHLPDDIRVSDLDAHQRRREARQREREVRR